MHVSDKRASSSPGVRKKRGRWEVKGTLLLARTAEAESSKAMNPEGWEANRMQSCLAPTLPALSGCAQPFRLPVSPPSFGSAHFLSDHRSPAALTSDTCPSDRWALGVILPLAVGLTAEDERGAERLGERLRRESPLRIGSSSPSLASRPRAESRTSAL